MLHHVRDIEEAGMIACPEVGVFVGEVGVVQGHGVGGEGDHFGTLADVVVVQRGVFEVLG